MIEPAPLPVRYAASRRELRAMGMGGAVLLVALFVFYALTLKPPLSPARLALFGLASLAVGIGYLLSVPRNLQLSHGGKNVPMLRTIAPIFAAALFWPFVLALLLRGRAPLYYYVIAFDGYSALALIRGRRWALALVAGIIAQVGLSYALLQGWSAAGPNLLGDLPWFVFMVVVAELYVRQWEQRDRTEALTAQLARANGQLRDYAARAEKLAVAQERARLAAEVHDTLGHTLTGLEMQLALLARQPPTQRGERQQAIQQAYVMAQGGLADLRRAVQALRPAALETLSLPEATQSLAEQLARAGGMRTTYQVEGEPVPLPAACTLLLYHACQEGLTNVQRHAPGAPHASVCLQYAPAAVSVRVENGAPASAPPAEPGPGSGTGLRSLQTRTAELGGTCSAGPNPEGGFRLEVRLPLPAFVPD